jgi:hypothetical protein
MSSSVSENGCGSGVGSPRPTVFSGVATVRGLAKKNGFLPLPVDQEIERDRHGGVASPPQSPVDGFVRRGGLDDHHEPLE